MRLEPNIIFIIIDALRARNLGCYGYSRQTSPNIDDLAKDGVFFENAFSCANATDPSVTTIFSGKYPRSHGLVKHGEGLRKEDIRTFNESETHLLPEILKWKGYTTLAVDWLGRWHRRGYDYYSGILKKRQFRLLYSLMVGSLNRFRPLYSLTKRLFKATSFIENAEMVTDRAINLLRMVHDKKFFLFVHYWDTHYPYNPPTCYKEKFINCGYGKNRSIEEILGQFDPKHRARIRDRLNNATTTSEVVARYDGAIAFIDHGIGRLVNTLKDYEILEQSLIVLTSDHGESLTEHGIYFEHHGLYDVSVHVPLILRYSELPRNMRIEGLVQQTDIVPTIVDILDMRNRSFEFDGLSTLPLVRNETKRLHSAVYFEEEDAEQKRAIRTLEYKYIYALPGKDAVCRRCGRMHGGMEELYDLKIDADETQNVLQEKPKVANSLRKKLDTWAESLERKKRKGKETMPDTVYQEKEEREIMERLIGLGYM